MQTDQRLTTAILHRAVACPDILYIESANGLLNAELSDPDTNKTVTVECVTDAESLTPIAIFLSSNPDAYRLADEFLSPREREVLIYAINTRLHAATVLLPANWWQQ